MGVMSHVSLELSNLEFCLKVLHQKNQTPKVINNDVRLYLDL